MISRRRGNATATSFDVRIRRARELLRANVAPAEIALSVGFADQAHLTRAFQARIGVAPGAIPVAVLVAVIPPTLLTSSVAESLAGAVAILAATRLPLLGTVAVGIAAVVLLRLALG
jgi:uncharacterized membrane protein